MATILIIEDDPNFARMVDKILRPHGHEVVHAGNALSGLHLAENNPVELVLLDMDLPDLDGKVVATTLRARSGMEGVPIIAVTAQSDAIARRLALAFGCDGFIPKPIDTRDFPNQVAAFLSQS
ncbi:MAG: response regulator transcription factor [Chloroflexi bacterium]|nr:response regulator transcription factor [Chloroflexota bacterium]